MRVEKAQLVKAPREQVFRAWTDYMESHSPPNSGESTRSRRVSGSGCGATKVSPSSGPLVTVMQAAQDWTAAYLAALRTLSYVRRF